jgi:hypothetical protein
MVGSFLEADVGKRQSRVSASQPLMRQAFSAGRHSKSDRKNPHMRRQCASRYTWRASLVEVVCLRGFL